MAKTLFQAPIDLTKHTSLIYAEGVFGLGARKKLPMRAKTADGILRYADYKIVGVVDSSVALRRGGGGEVVAGDIIPTYLNDTTRSSTPIFYNLKDAKPKTNANVLILGVAPEGGELPDEYRGGIAWAIKNKMHIVSGMHYALGGDKMFAKLARRNGIVLWDTRKMSEGELRNIPICSARAYHVKKPIVLTVGTDAAIGKMTVSYEMHQAAKKLGVKSCVIPTGQTAIMIEGWGVAIDALPADFMAGAVEEMVCQKAKDHDILFVEGQGSLFHPAFANTTISLIHGAVPTHMVLVHRPQRKHSIGSKLVRLPELLRAIEQYEGAVLPSYRNTRVVGIALNSEGISSDDLLKYQKEIARKFGLPVFDAIRDSEAVTKLVKKILISRAK